MNLTLRQRDIIRIILTAPCNIQFISNQLNISQRTVLREMQSVEDWFTSNDLVLIRKAGVGIYWQQGKHKLDDVLILLESSLAKNEYTKEERRRFIAWELLSSTEPIKSNYFQTKLAISAKVLASDLESITQWLVTYDIEVVKKPSLGICITQNEANIRKAIIGLIYETYGEDILFNFEQLSNLSNIEVVKLIIANIQDRANFTDRSYMALLIYLVVATHRMKQSCYVLVENIRADYINPGYFLAKQIALSIQERLNISVPEPEVIYLAGYFVAFDIPNIENFNAFFNKISQDVKEMILIVEKITHNKFSNDVILNEDLRYHIKVAIPRIEMGIQIQNSQLQFLKESCSQMFSATKEAFLAILANYNVYNVSDDEVGFATMHFCASAERMLVPCKIKVAITCPSGIGTSKMLQSRLNKKFPIFEVAATISIIDIAVSKLEAIGIKLIISTVGLNVEFPYIKVSPMLSQDDSATLKQLASELVTYEQQVITKEETVEKVLTLEDIEYATKLGQEIINVINSIFLYKSQDISSKYEMIQKIASLLGNDKDGVIAISKKLIDREAIASTYIKEFGIYLFHAKTSGVASSKLGLIKLMNPFYDDSGGRVLAGIVILVPSDANTAHIAISSAISMALADESTMAVIMQAKTRFDICKVVEQVLSKLYLEQITG